MPTVQEIVGALTTDKNFLAAIADAVESRYAVRTAAGETLNRDIAEGLDLDTTRAILAKLDTLTPGGTVNVNVDVPALAASLAPALANALVRHIAIS